MTTTDPTNTQTFLLFQPNSIQLTKKESVEWLQFQSPLIYFFEDDFDSEFVCVCVCWFDKMVSRVTFLIAMSVLLSISVSPSTAQDSLCADLSWELVGPYPYIPDATQTTQFLQLSCFTYQISAVITSPTWTIPC